MEICKTTGRECGHCMPGPCEHRRAVINKDERQGILTAAIDWYGSTHQVNMAIEEMAELTQALCKVKRAWSEEAIASIIEEMADVQIMLDQLRLIYGQTADIEAAKLLRPGGRFYLVHRPFRLQRRVIDAQESRSTN